MPSLTLHHTFHLSAESVDICHFASAEHFVSAWQASPRSYLLGGGSNTLFLEDFDGTVFINNMKGIEHQETTDSHVLRVAGGENWHQFVTYCLSHGFHGLENLALIPGSVGASPIQNIGAYGVEVDRFITQVDYVDIATGMHHQLTASACQFGYRDSIFKHALAGKVLITHVTFSLPKQYQPVVSYGELAALETVTPQIIYDTVIAVRQAKLPDPDKLGNAGSFFKNPVIKSEHYAALKSSAPLIPGFDVKGEVKVPAAWLIDQCGFKGQTLGGVRCHPTQPLVLTNTGNAKGSEVIQMARTIMQSVQDKFGITLEPEVRLVGREGVITL